MKLGSIVMLQMAVLAATLAACTVRPSDAGTNPDGAKGGAANGDGTSPGSTAGDAGRAGDAPADTPAATVPEKIAGTSWTWVTSGGAQRLAFASDGGYTSDVFLDGHPGDSCGTEYVTHREGAATFAGATLTLTPAISTRTKADSCSGEVVSLDVIDPVVTTYDWRLESGEADPDTLVLTNADGHEARYERD